MKTHIREGILYRNHHQRYYLWEPGVPDNQLLTCTSGCPLAIWLNQAWVAGHVEGDGEDYWLFVIGGGKFRLSEHMNRESRYFGHLPRSKNATG
ncbi:DUF5348 domain-containing protein [Ktedonobacter robiniae]|nr:DUF5348 domain-containing protein [Ktedonobacter robiniae]